ncbi:MAG: peptide-methionine (S)-S-oxide reductase MsrA [Anaerolineae bacterium]|nr:peptide-methionine (S)-S-oxide reductase MsrA [Anaerolineae bacterium]
MYETTTLGGGCFWCLEAVFSELKGVQKAESGYAGGSVPHPSYQAVCTGTTGHAEVVQVTFDPQVITYREILEVFFDIHDPTTLNRQGADVGTQYRSVVFYHDEGQKAAVEAMIADLGASGRWRDPIVTQVLPFDVFYKAEDYHQEYFKHNGRQPYCQMVVAPKLTKFRQHFVTKLK